jgi:hypothetical protein
MSDYPKPDPMPEPGSPELSPDWCHTHSCPSSDCPN